MKVMQWQPRYTTFPAPGFPDRVIAPRAGCGKFSERFRTPFDALNNFQPHFFSEPVIGFPVPARAFPILQG
jgi:hypothetical protein